jgi:hypothetical protein
MTTSSAHAEEYGKTHVDYSEDVKGDSSPSAADVANMERVELTEEDVRLQSSKSMRYLFQLADSY